MNRITLAGEPGLVQQGVIFLADFDGPATSDMDSRSTVVLYELEHVDPSEASNAAKGILSPRQKTMVKVAVAQSVALADPAAWREFCASAREKGLTIPLVYPYSPEREADPRAAGGDGRRPGGGGEERRRGQGCQARATGQQIGTRYYRSLTTRRDHS